MNRALLAIALLVSVPAFAHAQVGSATMCGGANLPGCPKPFVSPTPEIASIGASAQPTWAPLSQTEIETATPCMTRYVLGTGYMQELATCAGEKIIGSGIFFVDKRNGVQLPPDTVVDWRTTPLPDASTAWAVTAVTRIEQMAPHAPWRSEFYVLSGEQLDRMIEKARAEPDWKR